MYNSIIYVTQNKQKKMLQVKKKHFKQTSELEQIRNSSKKKNSTISN